MSDGEKGDKKKWRCPAAIVTGFILGGLTGAGAGSVVPILGTIGCGIVGAITGAGAGAASSC